jgi:hypothetical protein
MATQPFPEAAVFTASKCGKHVCGSLYRVLKAPTRTEKCLPGGWGVTSRRWRQNDHRLLRLIDRILNPDFLYAIRMGFQQLP